MNEHPKPDVRSDVDPNYRLTRRDKCTCLDEDYRNTVCTCMERLSISAEFRKTLTNDRKLTPLVAMIRRSDDMSNHVSGCIYNLRAILSKER